MEMGIQILCLDVVMVVPPVRRLDLVHPKVMIRAGARARDRTG